MSLHSLLLAISAVLLSIAQPQNANAQDSPYPAVNDPSPRIEFAKLARKRPRAWRLDGFEVLYQDVFGAWCTDASGQYVYLRSYPETNIITGACPVGGSDGYARARGVAAFRTPDGMSFNYGAYADGQPTGVWMGVSIDTLMDVGAACPTLFTDVPQAHTLDQLRDCFPDSATQGRIKVTEATFAEGKRDGAFTECTLSGRKRRIATFANDEPIGEELIFGTNDSLELRIDHAGSVSDTLYVQPQVADSVLEKTQHMPAFPGDCVVPDRIHASERDIEVYQQCTTGEMLLYINNTVKYPRSARRLGIEGTTLTTFVLEKDGSLTGIKTVRFVSASVDAEARRVVELMPAWKPGYQDGEAVRVQFNLPIEFRLE